MFNVAQLTSPLQLTYSAHVVALARLLDTARVALGVAEGYFSDMEAFEPDQYGTTDDFPVWTRKHLSNLSATLPGIKSLFLECVRNETPGMSIAADKWGDPKMPDQLVALLHPIAEEEFFYSDSDDCHTPILDFPADARWMRCSANAAHDSGPVVLKPGERAILNVGNGVVVPASISDSVIEVWYRRLFHIDIDPNQETDPLYLIRRSYGWQIFGCER